MSAGEHVSANHPGAADDAGGGLRRGITGITNGAITYACAGITAGIFSLFAFSLDASGPSFFWGWLLVGLSVGLACLSTQSSPRTTRSRPPSTTGRSS